jgi:hypothetical protein
MEDKKKSPMHLYKYRSFSAQTVDSLVSDKIFYADPVTFNDPLDTKPSLNADSPIETLQKILIRLVASRVKAEMTASAEGIKYRGPKTIAHIANHSARQAAKILAETEYYATNPDYGMPPEEALKDILTMRIQTELLGRYGKGVFSLAQRYSCPLMWSHYGDQHHGLCLGYTIPKEAKSSLHQVTYGGTRLIATSKIAAMLDGDNKARDEVDAAVLFRKASDWKYEKEWRHLGPKGLADSPLELTDITFGIRCASSVKHAVIRAVSGRDVEIKFFEMRENNADFRLNRYPVNDQELAASYPVRSLTALEAFMD